MPRPMAIVLTLVLAAGGGLPVVGQPPRMKAVLDTDIGTDIDDAWALGYAVKSPAFELLGVTITDADTPRRAKLACKLLSRLGRSDVPVAVGRRTAAVPPDRVDYQFAWAEDFAAYRPIPTPAVDFLAETIRRNPGEVTLIAVGPLQNLGDLVRQYPDVVPLVKRVVLMSGSIGANYYGPVPVAEWNVKLAIPEAQAVYAAAWPLTIVPLDSTSYVRLEDQERESCLCRRQRKERRDHVGGAVQPGAVRKDHRGARRFARALERDHDKVRPRRVFRQRHDDDRHVRPCRRRTPTRGGTATRISRSERFLRPRPA